MEENSDAVTAIFFGQMQIIHTFPTNCILQNMKQNKLKILQNIHN